MTRWTLLSALLGMAALPLTASGAQSGSVAIPDVDFGDQSSEVVAADEILEVAGSVTVVRRGAPARPAAPRAPAVRSSGATRVTITRPSTPSVPARSATVRVAPSVPARAATVRVAPVAPRVQVLPPRVAGVRVNINMHGQGPVPPPPSSVNIAPPPPPPSAAPPPPSTVTRPPQTTHSYGYRGPTVYAYPRVYSSVWGFWWWTPSTYNYHYHDAPARPQQQQQTVAEAPEPKDRSLHVGDTSFGVWGGVNRSSYQDGSQFSDPGMRFSIRHRTSAHTGIDISGGYYGTTMYPEGERNDRRIDVPIQVSGTLHLFPDLPVQLYGLAGVTADFRDYQKVDYTAGGKDFYYTEGRFEDARFGPHMGVGAELMLGPNLSVHGDARWTYFTVAESESLQQTIPTNFAANAGMSFYF